MFENDHKSFSMAAEHNRCDDEKIDAEQGGPHHLRCDLPFPVLVRSREGRALSHARYRTAHEFRSGVADDRSREVTDLFYMAGIVAQLALSSHLLDVGFPDAWCARHISLHVDRSLAYANATGFGYEDPETARLMQVLSPYWKWNAQHLIGRPRPSHGDFTREVLERLLDALLEHVSEVTGHVLTKPRKRRCAAPTRMDQAHHSA